MSVPNSASARPDIVQIQAIAAASRSAACWARLLVRPLVPCLSQQVLDVSWVSARHAANGSYAQVFLLARTPRWDPCSATVSRSLVNGMSHRQ
jgi:hypothetical protein